MTSGSKRRKLALLLPAHQEELIIQSTIRSAINSGHHIEDIYVVDDASTDSTREKVLEILPESNMLSVERSGKAGAVKKALEKFRIVERYQWIHVADADSIFDQQYFYYYSDALQHMPRDAVAAVGFVQSLKGNWLCTYRCFSYTYGQHLFRRLQSWFDMIMVMPGPVSCYRTDIIKHLDFSTGSLTEDFDITIQIHRKRLGKIRFIPEAINYTQDPRNIEDFYKQTLRWYRGLFQGAMRYRLGLRLHRIDISFMAQLYEFVNVSIIIGLAIGSMAGWITAESLLRKVLYVDLSITAAMGLFVTLMTLRARIIAILPVVYFLRAVEMLIYVQAFIEVIVLKRFTDHESVGWGVAGRRYALAPEVAKEL